MITVTSNAAERLLKEVLTEEEGRYLRAYVQGGGCSGFQYGLMPDKEPGPADQVFESNGVKILVDPVSISYLKETEIDFIESNNGGGFTIKNPNATSTCGCGQSFNTD